MKRFASSVFNLFLVLCSFLCRAIYVIAPAALVFYVLMIPAVQVRRGEPSVVIANRNPVSTYLPNVGWGDLEPCGKFFNEAEQLHIALHCANNKVWSETPLTEVFVPRCFVISAHAPAVVYNGMFNVLPLPTILGTFHILGLYDTQHKTIFVVDGVDVKAIYRHELQHYFLHLHDPETGGGGHYQEIWNQCEPPYYIPTMEAVIDSTTRKYRDEIVEKR